MDFILSKIIKRPKSNSDIANGELVNNEHIDVPNGSSDNSVDVAVDVNIFVVKKKQLLFSYIK